MLTETESAHGRMLLSGGEASILWVVLLVCMGVLSFCCVCYCYCFADDVEGEPGEGDSERGTGGSGESVSDSDLAARRLWSYRKRVVSSLRRISSVKKRITKAGIKVRHSISTNWKRATRTFARSSAFHECSTSTQKNGTTGMKPAAAKTKGNIAETMAAAKAQGMTPVFVQIVPKGIGAKTVKAGPNLLINAGKGDQAAHHCSKT
eukprot:gnl/MRDRNA2_/MRDRNA2_220511_c0_seq1.p1 gnl/MRDRNA2_/MRDRNA2_220511_c0~~gnl/MRDRNA2_/MRDRNA2_220511_c0_seq1.p1  ORF type:complete len:219 (+),score=28.13 gnl/MRDRNA2_/MRDRNA2_220511_c0_seq1:40-657(+)